MNVDVWMLTGDNVRTHERTPSGRAVRCYWCGWGSKHALRPNEGDQGGAWGMELNDAALAAGVTVLPSGPGLDVVVGNAGEEPDDEEAGELSD